VEQLMQISAIEARDSAAIEQGAIDTLRAKAREASDLLKHLGNEQRLLILCKLMEGECAVGLLAEHVGLAQSPTSQHLARLRESGLVAPRREGQTVYYRLADENALRVLQTLCEVFGDAG
jgi:DNA-binding transcriptional ArsR family regulator